MISAKTAVAIVEGAIGAAAFPNDPGHGHPIVAMCAVAVKVREHITHELGRMLAPELAAEIGPDKVAELVRSNEVNLAASGLALLAWAFWIMQCKAIEHYGRPDPMWRAILKDNVIAVLEPLLTEAREYPREWKQTEKDGGKEGIDVPPLFDSWKDDPWKW